jgi:hypothetical protein
LNGVSHGKLALRLAVAVGVAVEVEEGKIAGRMANCGCAWRNIYVPKGSLGRKCLGLLEARTTSSFLFRLQNGACSDIRL